MWSNLKFAWNIENQRQKRHISNSYLQQGGRTVLLAPQSQSLHLRVLKPWGRGSLQSWASSPPPAWGSYPWGSEGSSVAQRSAERGGSSRSWLQPSSASAGAGEECREAGCTLSECCRAGGGNHLAQLRERCTLLLMLRKMLFSAPWRLFSSCSVFFFFFQSWVKIHLSFQKESKVSFILIPYDSSKLINKLILIFFFLSMH